MARCVVLVSKSGKSWLVRSSAINAVSIGECLVFIAGDSSGIEVTEMSMQAACSAMEESANEAAQ